METATTIGYFWAAILGIIQGVAEFLPISSSGHLALAEHIGLGAAAPAFFDVFLHVATLGVVVIHFKKAILYYLRHDFKVLLYVVAACVPTGLFGLFCKSYFEALRISPNMICLGLLVTAALLFASEVRGGVAPLRDLGWFAAAVVGLCQALALTPGVSRSGATIAGTMICGIDREEAFRFSFILSIPAILGAVLLHVVEIFRHGGWAVLKQAVSPGPYLLGFVLAAATGALSLRFLERMVAKGRLAWFAVYCIIAAAAGLVYFNFIA